MDLDYYTDAEYNMNNYYDVYDNEAMRANANYNYKTKPFKSHESFSEPDFEEEVDMVNHPDHYMVGGIEALAVIEAKLGGPTNEMYRGYLMGNVMKYLMRSPYKGKREEDLKKAQFYLDGLVECFK
jgi:hypothetical protein